jgi:hypothetical protein
MVDYYSLVSGHCKGTIAKIIQELYNRDKHVISNEDLLSEAEICRRARNFLLMKHPESRVTFSSIQRDTREGTPLFQLAGTIEIKSPSIIDRFIFRSHPNRFSFNMELNAKQGKVLNYELR